MMRTVRGASRRPLQSSLSLILFLLPFTLFAADFQVSASLDRTQVALNEQATLALTLSGSGAGLPQPQLPALPNFQVANAGRSQNFTWINGQARASVTYNYVLTPLQEGRFTIPAIHVEHQGQAAETPALTLDVIKGEPNALPGSAGPEGARPSAPARGSAAIFITGTVNKESAVVGEPVVYSFRLYNRVPLLRQPSYQPPDTTGFWAEDLPPQRTYTESLRGVPYHVTEVRTALFPTSPGRARIGPAALSVTLENLGTDPFSNDFFANFFGRAEERTLRTEPIPLHVKPLPSPKPADFKGAVGRYTLTATLDKDSAAVGQPLTLTVHLSGRGNIKSLPDVSLPPLTHFRTFDANAATNIDKKSGEVQGSKVFKTVLIPTASGDLQIPAISFVYFDLDAQDYKAIRTRPLTVHVKVGAPGSKGSDPTLSLGSDPSRETPMPPGIRMLGEDIRYIKTPSNISHQGPPLYRRTWVRILHGLLFLGVLGMGFWRLYMKLFRSNHALTRFRKAGEEILAAAKSAEEALNRADIRGATGLLADGLQDYLAAKLCIESRSLALKEVLEGLRGRGLLGHTAEKVRNLWESLDLYQFAPAQVRPEEVRQTLRTLDHVVQELEREIVWKG